MQSRRTLVFACGATLIVTASNAQAQNGAVPPRLQEAAEAELDPDISLRDGATVELDLTIDASGRVTTVRVLKSVSNETDAAVMTAAFRFRFDPASVDGRNVASRIRYRYVLKPQSAPSAAPSTPPPTPSTPSVALPAASSTPPSIPRPGPPTGAQPEADARSQNDSEPRYSIRAELDKDETTETAIPASQARVVAGTQGDALRVLQSLPGVARPAFGSGQLVVWGAAPNDTKVYIDGVELPALYHLGGIRSLVHSDFVDRIHLVPGAFGASYGRAIGGLVTLDSRRLTPGTHGSATVDVIDSAARITHGSSKFRAGVSGRYGYLDSVLRRTVGEDFGDFYPIPKYGDAQTKVSIDLRRGETLDLVALGALDRLDRSLPSIDEAATRRERTERSAFRLYARYQRVLPNRTEISVVPFFGRDSDEVRNVFGPVPTTLDETSLLYGIRAKYQTALDERVQLSLGADVSATHSRTFRFGSLTLPPREGDISVFGQPPGDEVNADRFRTNTVDAAPFAELRWRLGNLVLKPGVRFDTYALSSSRRYPRVGSTPTFGHSDVYTVIEPRLALVWDPLERWRVFGNVGLYHQPAAPRDRGSVFGNPTLGLERSFHAALGSNVQVTDDLDVEGTCFVRVSDDLVVRSADRTPAVSEALVQSGTGRTYGAQFVVRQRLAHGLFGWVTYTLSRSERSDGRSPYRLFDYNQTHVLTAVASYSIDDWTFGTRFRLSSGYPRTPVVDAYYDAHRDRYDPVFGAQNSFRIPAFAQWDLRMERAFHISTAVASVYVDAQNVLATSNPEELAYSYDYATRRYITGVPFLAVVGLRVEF